MQQWGPFKRQHGPTGAPADHFRSFRGNRFAAVDHDGRITTLVADGVDVTPADEDELRQLLVDAVFDALEDEELAEGLEELETWELEHLALDHGLFDEDGPLGQHGVKTVTHSHEHSAMGDQGGDETHNHKHTHSGDASHNHDHPAVKLNVTKVQRGGLASAVAEARRRHHRLSTPDVERMRVKAFGHFEQGKDGMQGGVEVELAVRYDPETDALVSSLEADGMVAASDGVPQIVANPGGDWHAYLCVEGIRTDEFPSRLLTENSCQVPDLPVSLRFLVEDEGGHYGAITCGRIDAMDRTQVEGYNAMLGKGVFGTDENSQVAQLHVEEQTQRFISIDPRDVDAEIVEVEVSKQSAGIPMDCDDGPESTVDLWVQYSSLVIGAATIVATPALQQAVITMADQELPWSSVSVERSPAVVTAAGEPLAAPAEWFQNPGFHVGDPRLVRQEDGKYACPLTVTDDGRVFGHVAYWGAQHTGFPGRKITPPHSPSYAYFQTGSYKTAEGEQVPVGQITMGCGHASVNVDYRAAAAHYDGGYGAVQMADVCAGEDDFGIWIAGSLRPLRSTDNPQGPTPEQVNQFRALGLSGDWRPIAGAKHFVACLAVPVQGFPISREALVASGAQAAEHGARASLDADGEVLSLVAAGRVQRRPDHERLTSLEHKVDTVLDFFLEEKRRAEGLAAQERLRSLTGGE